MCILRFLDFDEILRWDSNKVNNARYVWKWINTLRLRQNGRQLPGNNFKFIFFNENISIAINISLKFLCKGPVNNIPAVV